MKRTSIGGCLLLALLAISCQPSTPAETPPHVAQLPARPTPPADTAHVVAEQLMGQLFEALAYQKLRPLLNTYTKHVAVARNPDDAQQLDSTVTYSAGANSFVYVQSGGEAALLRCQIATWPSPLVSGIQLGASRVALGKVVAHPFSAAVLRVTETEGYQKFYFVLKNDTLQMVKFESDYLD